MIFRRFGAFRGAGCRGAIFASENIAPRRPPRPGRISSIGNVQTTLFWHCGTARCDVRGRRSTGMTGIRRRRTIAARRRGRSGGPITRHSLGQRPCTSNARPPARALNYPPKPPRDDEPVRRLLPAFFIFFFLHFFFGSSFKGRIYHDFRRVRTQEGSGPRFTSMRGQPCLTVFVPGGFWPIGGCAQPKDWHPPSASWQWARDSNARFPLVCVERCVSGSQDFPSTQTALNFFLAARLSLFGE